MAAHQTYSIAGHVSPPNCQIEQGAYVERGASYLRILERKIGLGQAKFHVAVRHFIIWNYDMVFQLGTRDGGNTHECPATCFRWR